MLHYTIFGLQDAPRIVLLHPANYDSRLWREIASHLPQYCCVAVDLPGHGASKDHELTTLEDAADAVAEIIRSFDPPPIAIIGISLGAYVGFETLSRHPSLVEYAVLSGFQSSPIQLNLPMRFMMAISSRLMAFKWVREKMSGAMGVRDPALSSNEDGKANASTKTTNQAVALALDFDAREKLAGVTGRTLVIAGEKEHATIKSSLAIFEDGMPNAHAMIVSDLGHGWGIEAPELFARTVRAWLTEHPLPDGLVRPEE